jgi:hypothetical protein
MKKTGRSNPTLQKTKGGAPGEKGSTPFFFSAKPFTTRVYSPQMVATRQVPEIYLRLGDDEGARDSLDELIKIADKLYSIDSDADDPNQAFKAMWPSANLWRDCVALAAKLAAVRAEEIIRGIPDPEIRAFERITLANSLLGADIPSLSIIEKHKTGIIASMGL